jgi:fanconi-associated nuclease 1
MSLSSSSRLAILESSSLHNLISSSVAMSLQAQSPSHHNKFLGQRIPHPPSTNFEDSNFSTPAAKRLKRLDSRDSADSSSRDVSDDEETSRTSTPIPTPRNISRREIPDSEDEGDDNILPSSQTDLETALPPVKTDKEAIAQYEASRAAAEPGLYERLGKRQWHKGRSSIYVDAFNLALETVLEEEGHLFDEAEMGLFEAWRGLKYESQYLYVRLFLRKTAAWHRVMKLGYYDDIADLPGAVVDLQSLRSLPASTAVVQENPGELEAPEGTALGRDFRFAESSDGLITTLEEASSLLLLEELKGITKEARVTGKNKTELLTALRKTSGKQGGLGWKGLKRADTEESVKSENNSDLYEDSDSPFQEDDLKVNRDSHFLRKIMSHTGPCIRLAVAPCKLFERVHLVFYRSTEWTEKSLTTIILARISRRNFPEYIVSRSANIFPSRAFLLEFEAALRTQFRVDNILEFNGPPGSEGYQKVKDIFEEVYPRWKALLEEEQRKEDRVYETGEGAYLRRFSPAWVYTRIIHKGLAALGRFKEHKREHEILTELLDQHLFHAARRGAWHQRKALLEEHYLWALTPSQGRSDEAQKKHWKRIALRSCELGLEDRDCHLIYHYDLQKRIMKLEKSLKVVKREQHDFGHVRLVKPEERTVEGIRVEKEEIPNGNRRGSDASSRRGRQTVWIDGREGGGECRVESMCLSWYRDQAWKGYHCEGGIVRTLVSIRALRDSYATYESTVRIPLLRRHVHLRAQCLPDTISNVSSRPPHGRLLSLPSLRNQSSPCGDSQWLC